MSHSQDFPPASAELQRQRFSVSFEYPVYFTRDLLDPANRCLVNAISAREPDRRHRLLAVVDAGVWAAWPQLGERLSRYCQAYHTTLQLVCEPLVVPGGAAARAGRPASADPTSDAAQFARVRGV